ncbi:MAG: mechanosensitive ion channel [Neisseriaceae bacterium]|nr:MAG: mechanosensitive ion channel [Neisseriaceae bacterium]
MSTDLLTNIQKVYTGFMNIPFYFTNDTHKILSSKQSLLELLLVSMLLLTILLIIKKTNNRSGILAKYSLNYLFIFSIIGLLSGISTSICITYFDYFPFWLYLLTAMSLWGIVSVLIIKLLAHVIPYKLSNYNKKIAIVLASLVFVLWFSGLGKSLMEFSQTIQISIGKISISIFTLIIGIFWSIIAFIVTLWLSRFAETRIMSIDNVDENFKLIISKLLKFLIIFISVTIILPIFGIDITTLTILGGAFAAGLGFSLRDIVSNYISGFIILFDQSIRIHDRIKVNNFTGYVTHISTRFVTLKSHDGTEALIPNQKIISDIVKNESMLAKELLQEFSLKLEHVNDIAGAIKIIQKNIRQHVNVNNQKKITVVLHQIDPIGIEIKSSYWINTLYPPAAETHSEILQQIYNDFQENDILLAKYSHYNV